MFCREKNLLVFFFFKKTGNKVGFSVVFLEEKEEEEDNSGEDKNYVEFLFVIEYFKIEEEVVIFKLEIKDGYLKVISRDEIIEFKWFVEMVKIIIIELQIYYSCNFFVFDFCELLLEKLVKMEKFKSNIFVLYISKIEMEVNEKGDGEKIEVENYKEQEIDVKEESLRRSRSKYKKKRKKKKSKYRNEFKEKVNNGEEKEFMNREDGKKFKKKKKRKKKYKSLKDDYEKSEEKSKIVKVEEEVEINDKGYDFEVEVGDIEDSIDFDGEDSKSKKLKQKKRKKSKKLKKKKKKTYYDDEESRKGKEKKEKEESGLLDEEKKIEVEKLRKLKRKGSVKLNSSDEENIDKKIV